MTNIRSVSISSLCYLFVFYFRGRAFFKQRQQCVGSDFYIGPVYKTNKSLVCMTRYHLIIGDTILEILEPSVYSLPDERAFDIYVFVN